MIFILTGPVHSGKSSFLKQLVEWLKQRKVRVRGFLTKPVLFNDKRLGYDLIDLISGHKVPFLRSIEKPGRELGFGFAFVPEGLRTAVESINQVVEGELLVVDEVGPAELKGEGLWPALEKVLNRVDCLLVVRESLLSQVSGLLGRQEIEVFRIEKGQKLETIGASIKKNLK